MLCIKKAKSKLVINRLALLATCRAVVMLTTLGAYTTAWTTPNPQVPPLATNISASPAPATNLTNSLDTTPAPAPIPATSTCLSFNNVAMQFSLVPSGMQPPLNLEQLKTVLGNQKPETATIITNYIWVYKNYILSATAMNNNLTNRLLTGGDDNSAAASKMQQIYAKLKTATSVWITKDINAQLGPCRTTTTKLYTYTWRCGCGTVQISADDNNNLKSAQITYETNQDPVTIESQVGGTNHIPWDISNNSNNQSQRGWRRTFNV